MTEFDVRKIPVISTKAAIQICDLLEIDYHRVEAHTLDLELNPNGAPRISLSVYLTSDEVHEVLAILGKNLIE